MQPAKDEQLSEPERGLTIVQENTVDLENRSSIYMEGESLRNLMDSSSRFFDAKNEGIIDRRKSKMEVQSDQTKHELIRKHFEEVFKKEVDFHHKLAYRFEKAYRLGKEMPDKRHTLNVEIIDCISEHSGYVEEDPMSLFYCLFFCIYYLNQDLVEFLRILVHKLPANEKIDRLLEYIDIYGLKRLRAKGEQMNMMVYHMVFYQAVDDDLRIVYSQIFYKLRFIQLRDKDALQFLY